MNASDELKEKVAKFFLSEFDRLNAKLEAMNGPPMPDAPPLAIAAAEHRKRDIQQKIYDLMLKVPHGMFA